MHCTRSWSPGGSPSKGAARWAITSRVCREGIRSNRLAWWSKPGEASSRRLILGGKCMSSMKPEVRHRRRRQDGHAVIEIALLAPWIFFLFAGTLDMGFYLSALIATQNAARVAA